MAGERHFNMIDQNCKVVSGRPRPLSLMIVIGNRIEKLHSTDDIQISLLMPSYGLGYDDGKVSLRYGRMRSCQPFSPTKYPHAGTEEYR